MRKSNREDSAFGSDFRIFFGNNRGLTNQKKPCQSWLKLAAVWCSSHHMYSTVLYPRLRIVLQSHCEKACLGSMTAVARHRARPGVSELSSRGKSVIEPEPCGRHADLSLAVRSFQTQPLFDHAVGTHLAHQASSPRGPVSPLMVSSARVANIASRSSCSRSARHLQMCGRVRPCGR